MCYTESVHGPLEEIQQKIARGDFVLSTHFVDAMRDDRLFLADILSAIDGAAEAVEDGCDAQGDPKYKVPGDALDGRRIEVVCILKRLVVLVTVYAMRNVP